mmetsp:Transcript_54287/g.65307  ORF Transcript_54287/g.65307 Transcript_54287/m.65307 type:complete len:209 (-) Transcript_54287:1213-1839(-)
MVTLDSAMLVASMILIPLVGLKISCCSSRGMEEWRGRMVTSGWLECCNSLRHFLISSMPGRKQRMDPDRPAFSSVRAKWKDSRCMREMARSWSSRSCRTLFLPRELLCALDVEIMDAARRRDWSFRCRCCVNGSRTVGVTSFALSSSSTKPRPCCFWYSSSASASCSSVWIMAVYALFNFWAIVRISRGSDFSLSGAAIFSSSISLLI